MQNDTKSPKLIKMQEGKNKKALKKRVYSTSTNTEMIYFMKKKKKKACQVDYILLVTALRATTVV